MNQQKKRAWNAVQKALASGLLERPGTCEFCKLGTYLHAHHDDYEQPLVVAWLCSSCHQIVHALLRGERVYWLEGDPHGHVDQERAA